MGKIPDGKERRQFKRVYKNYVIRFCKKFDKTFHYEATQVLNIGQGGLCFASTHAFDVGTELYLEVRTPFISEIIFLEGIVLDSEERVKDMIYHVRVKFENTSSEAYAVLKKLEEYSEKE